MEDEFIVARQVIKSVHLERQPHRAAMERLQRVYQLLRQAADPARDEQITRLPTAESANKQSRQEVN